MKKKVAYIVSNVNLSKGFEWIAEELDSNKFHLSFILLNNKESILQKNLQEKGITCHRLDYHGKKSIPQSIYTIYKLIKREKIDVVHCHLVDASLCGLIAAKLAGLKKRIHTRHHSTFHYLYHPKGIYLDRFINNLSATIISISSKVSQLLIEKENVKANKISLVHHGFKLEDFEDVPQLRVQNIRQKYNLPPNSYMIGVISRFEEWKGVQYTVEAFKKYLLEFPDTVLLMVGYHGNYESHILKLLKTIPEKNYRLIESESDIFAIYKIFDLFVHVPINDNVEAYGQVYVESLFSKVPSVFTLSGVANDFIVDKKNALVVDFCNADAIYKAMVTIKNDKELSDMISENGFEDVVKNFTLSSMISKLEKIYLSK